VAADQADSLREKGVRTVLPDRELILAGDIGATHTRLALMRFDGDRFVETAARVYPSRDYDGLEPIVADFASGATPRGAATRRGAAAAGGVAAACFGVAGPVRDGRSATTNLPWIVDEASLSRVLGGAPVRLLNDLEASAWGLEALAPHDLEVIAPGTPDPRGNAALIAAGTGLGEAGLAWDGSGRRPFACEGGHADFAPADALQDELLAWLRRRHAHVSWERALSGPGLLNLYEFLRDTGRGEEPRWLRDALAAGDPPAVIGRASREGSSDLCVRAVDLFVALYGAEAGNLALKMMATAGVYLGGGIAPRILEGRHHAPFLEAFRAKGRMRPLLQAMPVSLVRNERMPLLGAARRARLEVRTP
jgi:glucokinase